MADAADWTEILPVDTRNDVHVTDTKDGIYIFYTENETAYIRTDTVVDVTTNR